MAPPTAPVPLPDAARALGPVWAALTPGARGVVVDPVRRLARAGRQQDGTTCGSAVLTMLAAAGDPRLAAWLATGRPPEPDAVPPELDGAPSPALQALRDAPVEERFARVHRVVKRRTNALRPGRAGVTVPWPAALGTPPWGAARVARYPGVRWRHRPLAASAEEGSALDTVLDTALDWVAAGVPVPLFCGGDTTGGWASALPRHVVLLLTAGPRETGGGRPLEVWEPARGEVVRTTRDALVAGGAPQRALGGWTRPVWAVVPWRDGATGSTMGDDRPRVRGEAMSTTPGDSTWADAGLVPPDSSAVPDAGRSTVPVDPSTQPRAPKPVLRDEAPDHDVQEQHQDTRGRYPTAAEGLPDDAPEADALEQAQDVTGAGYAPSEPTPGSREDATEADLLEQAQEVPDDDEEYPAQ